MNIHDEARKIFKIWLRGREVEAIRVLNEYDKPVALAILMQMMLIMLDHDSMGAKGIKIVVPNFVELMETVAHDPSLLLVSEVQDS